MKRTLLCAALLLLFLAPAWAARYDAQGLVVKIDKPHNSLVISCDRIPGFMDAMVMPFPVRDPKELDGLDVGAMIQFTLVVNKSSSYIESIHIHHYESMEQDPISARRLKLMASLMDGGSAPPELKVGEHLPDFSLIDQSNQTVTFSQFSGKVVAITFTYTHCALPNFCFRIANSFRTLQKRFASQMGSDLVLLTITFDPAHDTPKVMAQYGKTWNADPKSWHLLTGPPDQVQQLCARFGISFWPDEGLMTHSLHTLIVDRNGNLVADLEGNEFTADQLGDLVQSVLARDPQRSAPRPAR